MSETTYPGEDEEVVDAGIDDEVVEGPPPNPPPLAPTCTFGIQGRHFSSFTRQQAASRAAANWATSGRLRTASAIRASTSEV